MKYEGSWLSFALRSLECSGQVTGTKDCCKTVLTI